MVPKSDHGVRDRQNYLWIVNEEEEAGMYYVVSGEIFLWSVGITRERKW